MNTEQITQVVEAIKTLNININDATTQKIADAIIPVVKMYIIKDYIQMGLLFILGLAFFYTVAWITISVMKMVHEEEAWSYGGKVFKSDN
jgi:hypothetical protein